MAAGDTRSKDGARRRPGAATSVMRFLDVGFILVTSFTIAFTILWAASTVRGRPMFQELPAWVTQTVSSVWTQLTGAAGAGAFIVRCLRAGSNVRRNYLLPCGVGAAMILVAVIGVANVLPAPAPPPGPSAHELWFQVAFDPPAPEPLNLSFVHSRPEGRLPIRLAPQAAGDYLTTIKLPRTAGEHYLGFFQRLVQHSERRSAPSETVVCLQRNDGSGTDAPRELVLACQESKGCAIPPGRGAGGIRPCSEPPRARGWLTAAYAQPADSASSTGWVVPTLETLRETGGRHGLGYTAFELETGPLPSLTGADGLIYRVRVNGRPIYFGGWKPERLKTSFDPTVGLGLAFGLENLDFAGAKAGAEEIEVTIDFLAHDKTLRTLRVRLDYVALRDGGPAEIKLDDINLRWRATYARPEREHKFEIFVSTEPLMSGAAADARKRRVDAAKLTVGGQRVVGVIRPPLPPNRNFGVVLGLEEPTGQVRFTFDEVAASRLCREVLRLARAPERGISPHAFRYEMEPRPPRVPATRPCRAS